jgi:nuclear GTP-binding protein
MPKSSFKKGGSSDNVDRVGLPKDGGGHGGLRDKATRTRLKMYRSGKPIRNKDGQIIGGDFMDWKKAGNADITGATGRVGADRRWFGNTRVVSQKELDKFREVVAKESADPYTVLLHSKALPMGLLVDPKTRGRAHLLSAESFSETFGPGKQRKRPRLAALDLSALAATASASADGYDAEADTRRADGAEDSGVRAEMRNPVFEKGQSRRIWGELYKVLDCSDVVVQVLDARDPMGTRCPHVERHLKENARHKHLVFVLNKCDLVPTWVTRRWVAALSKEYPTLAFHASLTKPFGKGSLIALLRQLSKLHNDKKSISVGFIGYPNVGKSSVINALKAKKVCSVAPIPGQTKVWQYVTLMKRVNLVDCPGVVYDAGDTETDTVLKGVVRAEKLGAPELFVGAILDRVKPEHVRATYGVADWTDPEDFLTKLCVKTGRLIKGGEPDLSVTAVNIINDWQRGKLPFFAVPPDNGGPGRGPAGAAAAAAAAAATAAAAAGAAEATVAGDAAAAALAAPAQDLRRLGRHELLADEEEEGEEEEIDGDGCEEDEEEDDEEEEDEEEEEEAPKPRAGSKRPREASAEPSSSSSSRASSSAAAAASGGKGAARPQKKKTDVRSMADSFLASASAVSSAKATTGGGGGGRGGNGGGDGRKGGKATPAGPAWARDGDVGGKGGEGSTGAWKKGGATAAAKEGGGEEEDFDALDM